jgi:hypothetical protein
VREEQHRQEEQVLMVLLSGFWGNSDGYLEASVTFKGRFHLDHDFLSQ